MNRVRILIWSATLVAPSVRTWTADLLVLVAGGRRLVVVRARVCEKAMTGENTIQAIAKRIIRFKLKASQTEFTFQTMTNARAIWSAVAIPTRRETPLCIGPATRAGGLDQ